MGKYAKLNVRYTHFSLPLVACIYEKLIKDLKKKRQKTGIVVGNQTRHKKKTSLRTSVFGRIRQYATVLGYTFFWSYTTLNMKITLFCDTTPWWSVEKYAYPEDGGLNLPLNVNNKLRAKSSHIREFCKPLQQRCKNFKLHIIWTPSNALKFLIHAGVANHTSCGSRGAGGSSG